MTNVPCGNCKMKNKMRGVESNGGIKDIAAEMNEMNIFHHNKSSDIS